jgi:hypothetical protein
MVLFVLLGLTCLSFIRRIGSDETTPTARALFMTIDVPWPDPIPQDLLENPVNTKTTHAE